MNTSTSEPDVLDLWRRCAPPDASEHERVLRFHDALTRGVTPLDELDLPTHVLNLLRRNGVTNAEQLRSMSWGRLVSLRGVGPSRAREIRRLLGVL